VFSFSPNKREISTWALGVKERSKKRDRRLIFDRIFIKN
jgi:hypothetical protein